MTEKVNRPHFKIGDFSREDVAFIKANMDMPVELISKHLNRSPKNIQKHIDTLLMEKHGVSSLPNDLVVQLKAKPWWADKVEQLSKHELESFIYNWIKYTEQFRNDVTHSEEAQIEKVITLEILINRNMSEKAATDIKIQKLEDRLTKELAKEVPNDNLIGKLDNQLLGLKASQEARLKQHNDMLKQSREFIKDLKSTRDQRLDKIESGKVTFFSFMEQFKDVEKRKKLSREAELMRLAMIKAKTDMAEYHTFQDGSLDQILLTPETIKEDNNTEI